MIIQPTLVRTNLTVGEAAAAIAPVALTPAPAARLRPSATAAWGELRTFTYEGATVVHVGPFVANALVCTDGVANISYPPEVLHAFFAEDDIRRVLHPDSEDYAPDFWLPAVRRVLGSAAVEALAAALIESGGDNDDDRVLLACFDILHLH